jgi:hypothetical protein
MPIMKALPIMLRLGLVIASGIEISSLPAIAQTTALNNAQATTPSLRKLSGEDAKHAEELDKAIEAAIRADRWDDAIASAEELLALRVKVQGPTHFETVSDEWRLKALRRVAPMPKEDRVAYVSAITINEQAAKLNAQGK